ncbi:HNH endonuclease family protein [Streptomyces sp. NPDC087440]|uniref:HNH endonuclease family protein n=1 Tax=Streptomyces sp. NPDC087440 TaxID=3365790 RepID=UPI00382FC07F
MRVRTLTTLAAATAALAALLTPGAQAAAGPAANPHGAPGDILVMPVQDVLKALPVAAEDRTGYERTKFKHWVDVDKNGCNTRSEVLLAEAFVPPEKGAKCKLVGGEWWSLYDNTYVGDAGKIDIDHTVPLAEAWDSGASAWTAEQRQAYANDLGDDRSLIAVSATTNRAKGDKDPTTWMPPSEAAHCAYLTNWAATKLRWGLTVDPAEANALAQIGVTCSNPPVKVTLAR